jgi:cytosine/adenosine deaminase-related metal-dependent hydrolase
MYVILRARSLFPVSSPPIDNGAVVIEEGRIRWFGRWRELSEAVPDAQDAPVDLGEVALMPGLVNAHCHLDYTSMAGQIPAPKSFPDWVKNILAFKAHWSFSEFAESWLKGSRMLLDSGVTTVADTESVPELPPETWKSTPLRMISLLEITCVKSQRNAREVLAEALDWIDRWPPEPRKESGLSPHALYSTVPELMRLSAAAAQERGCLLSIHLAESEPEYRMFSDAAGSFYDWLKGQRRMDDCGRMSPVQLAREYGVLSDRTLVIHANYLALRDAETLGEARASVVHCPRSHDYFSHQPFPFEELKKAGVNVCLGTDSLASMNKSGGQAPVLNFWQDLQLFAARRPGVSPREVISMATLNGAAALRKPGQIGEIKRGACADLAALAYTGRVEEARMAEELLFNPGVREVFIGGELARPASGL